jgi:hypothetical protein
LENFDDDDDDDDDDDMDISRAGESFRENIKASATESLQNPSQTSGDKLISVKCEISITFKTKKREYLKEKLMRLKQTVRAEHK